MLAALIVRVTLNVQALVGKKLGHHLSLAVHCHLLEDYL